MTAKYIQCDGCETADFPPGPSDYGSSRYHRFHIAPSIEDLENDAEKAGWAVERSCPDTWRRAHLCPRCASIARGQPQSAEAAKIVATLRTTLPDGQWRDLYDKHGNKMPRQPHGA